MASPAAIGARASRCRRRSGSYPPSGRLGEDVAAERGEDRLVEVRLAHRDRPAAAGPRRPCRPRRPAGRPPPSPPTSPGPPGSGGVAVERDVLDQRRHAVEHATERERLERDGKEVGGPLTEVDRRERRRWRPARRASRGDPGSGPAPHPVGADELELAAQLGARHLLDVDRDAVLGGEQRRRTPAVAARSPRRVQMTRSARPDDALAVDVTVVAAARSTATRSGTATRTAEPPPGIGVLIEDPHRSDRRRPCPADPT